MTFSNTNILLPLYAILGSDDELCYFILCLLNQLNSNIVWEKYCIEKSGRVRGVDTTYNARLEGFFLFEETPYLRDKFLSFIETQNRRVAPTITAQPTDTFFALKLSKHLNNINYLFVLQVKSREIS